MKHFDEQDILDELDQNEWRPAREVLKTIEKKTQRRVSLSVYFISSLIALPIGKLLKFRRKMKMGYF
jgi:hypothetical protein